MLHGRYHPITQCKLTAGLDAKGDITALHIRIAGQSILASLGQTLKDGKDPVVFQGLNAPGPEASIGYSFPNLLVDHAMRNPPVPAGRRHAELLARLDRQRRRQRHRDHA